MNRGAALPMTLRLTVAGERTYPSRDPTGSLPRAKKSGHHVGVAVVGVDQ
jgi:hypothetical protein